MRSRDTGGPPCRPTWRLASDGLPSVAGRPGESGPDPYRVVLHPHHRHAPDCTARRRKGGGLPHFATSVDLQARQVVTLEPRVWNLLKRVITEGRDGRQRGVNRIDDDFLERAHGP